MIGALLSKAVKLVTLPVDIVESGVDVLIGGDGSKRSKSFGFNPLSEIRNGVCKAIEEVDG